MCWKPVCGFWLFGWFFVSNSPSSAKRKIGKKQLWMKRHLDFLIWQFFHVVIEKEFVGHLVNHQIGFNDVQSTLQKPRMKSCRFLNANTFWWSPMMVKNPRTLSSERKVALLFRFQIVSFYWRHFGIIRKTASDFRNRFQFKLFY